MKKICIYLFLMFVVLLNIYLIFLWNPGNKVVNSEDASKETVSYTKTLYKVDKEKVLDQLSVEDRKDFNKILKKLSTYDMGKIKEYYEDNDEEEGIANAFGLLKKRLSDEDYKRIEEISSSFIAFDKMSKKIKK